MPASQAGRRGFESRLPLQETNHLRNPADTAGSKKLPFIVRLLTPRSPREARKAIGPRRAVEGGSARHSAGARVTEGEIK